MPNDNQTDSGATKFCIDHSQNGVRST